LLAHFDWRSVFVFGGVATLCFVPLVLRYAPESIAFLVHRRPRNALERVNRALARMGRAGVETLPEGEDEKGREGAPALFSKRFVGLTSLLTLAYFAHIMTFYFILKWIPKIVADMGFAASAAGGVLVWASIGGAAGSLLVGLLTLRIRVYWLTVGAMLASTALVILFGQQHGDLFRLSQVAAAAGFVTNAGVVGLYALIAGAFPTGLRASATGVVIGVGRGGSALAPALAGLLFANGQGLPAVAALMAVGSLVAALALLGIRRQTMVAA
jgi:predicted MFS family arabinose efflux permease